MKYLAGCGISCSKGAADLGTVFGIPENERIPEDSIRVIGSTFSPEFAEIVSETNHESNNVYAETLFRTLGKELRKGCQDSAFVAVTGILEELGLDTGARAEHRRRQRAVPAEQHFPGFMCGFLKAMMDSPVIRDLCGKSPATRKHWNPALHNAEIPVRCKVQNTYEKSGSMTGVRC